MITDAVPTGTTFVAASVNVIAPLAITTNTVFEQFTPAVYTNNNGTTNWSAGWSEISDDNSPTAGTVLIIADRLRIDQAGLNDGI
ncbi:MAG: hypothetical protein O2923_11155 [Verrucomicrobia bacterium]|nr:hypothetical protein [Verrucomicrobiota bacterium]MDA1087214.1 hypothetical protein [Verrucomicrobiota bacterium]